MPAPPRIDCHQCRHYYVTWQKTHPHGCKVMGFKSAQMPSQAVYQSSGRQCLYFEAKRRSKHAQHPDHH